MSSLLLIHCPIRVYVSDIPILAYIQTIKDFFRSPDKGDVFGWGNSEYGQLGLVTDETQVNMATHLPTPHCGRVVKAVAGGSLCALLNGQFLTCYPLMKERNLFSTTQFTCVGVMFVALELLCSFFSFCWF